MTGYIKIGGNINCAGEGACVNLGNINNNENDGYALSVSGSVKSPVLFSKDSVVSATFTNEGTLNNIVNTGTITNGITNNKGTIGDITN